MRFIKLTDPTSKGAENPIYVKIEDISSIDTDAWNGKTLSVIQTPYTKLYVKESPDQIMEKIRSKDENTCKITLDNGFKIASHPGVGDFKKTMCIYIEDPNGDKFQNIATLEPYTFIQDGNLVQSDNTFHLRVWADDEDEDFTDQFIIDRYPYY